MALIVETGMVVHKACVEKAKDMQGLLSCVVDLFAILCEQ